MPFNFTSESLFIVLLFIGLGSISFLLSLPYIFQKDE